MTRFPYGEPDRNEEQEDLEPREAPTCKHCGMEDLEWVDIGMGRWRLYEGQKLHDCLKRPASLADFEDLSS